MKKRFDDQETCDMDKSVSFYNKLQTLAWKTITKYVIKSTTSWTW